MKIHDETGKRARSRRFTVQQVMQTLADSDSDGAEFDQDYALSSDKDTESERSRSRSSGSGSLTSRSRSMFSLNFAQEARNSGQLGSGPKAGHTLHKPITQVTCLKPYCTITVSSLVQVPPTHYAMFFLN